MSQKKPVRFEKTNTEKAANNKDENDEDSSSDSSDSSSSSTETVKSVTRKQPTTKVVSLKQKIRAAPVVVSPVEPPPLRAPVAASTPLKSMLSPVSATSTIAATAATNISRFVQITTSDGQSEYYVVFAVNDHASHHKPYALKAELTKLREGETKRGSDLKNELTVLTKIGNIRQKMANWGKHFLEYVDCGSYKNFRFIVTALCGPNLRVLRSSILKRNFTMSSALLINYNTFTAINDLHKLGYVHTAIRPSHFAVGNGSLSNIIYLIDFTRCYNPSSSSSIRNYVRRVNTRETLKFASRSMMDDKNMPTFQDDLESWVYMSIDIVNDSLLPWNSKMPAAKMRAAKVEFFYHIFSKELDTSIPDEYRAIIDVLNSTHNRMSPKYDRILSLLRQGLKHRNLDVENDDEQYRWQQYLDKKKLEPLNTPLYVASKIFSPQVTNSFLDMLFKDDLQSQDEGEVNKRKKDQTTTLESKGIRQQQRITEDKDVKRKGATTTTPAKKSTSKKSRSTDGKESQDKKQSKGKKATIGQPPKAIMSSERVGVTPLPESDGTSIPPSSDVQLSEPPAKELSSPLKPEENEMLKRMEVVKEAQQPVAKPQSKPFAKKTAGQLSNDCANKAKAPTKRATRTAVPSPKIVAAKPSTKHKVGGGRTARN